MAGSLESRRLEPPVPIGHIPLDCPHARPYGERQRAFLRQQGEQLPADRVTSTRRNALFGAALCGTYWVSGADQNWAPTGPRRLGVCERRCCPMCTPTRAMLSAAASGRWAAKTLVVASVPVATTDRETAAERARVLRRELRRAGVRDFRFVLGPGRIHVHTEDRGALAVLRRYDRSATTMARETAARRHIEPALLGVVEDMRQRVYRRDPSIREDRWLDRGRLVRHYGEVQERLPWASQHEIRRMAALRAGVIREQRKLEAQGVPEADAESKARIRVRCNPASHGLAGVVATRWVAWRRGDGLVLAETAGRRPFWTEVLRHDLVARAPRPVPIPPDPRPPG